MDRGLYSPCATRQLPAAAVVTEHSPTRITQWVHCSAMQAAVAETQQAAVAETMTILIPIDDKFNLVHAIKVNFLVSVPHFLPSVRPAL